MSRKCSGCTLDSVSLSSASIGPRGRRRMAHVLTRTIMRDLHWHVGDAKPSAPSQPVRMYRPVELQAVA
eukprot:6753786-Prymnesium_polylepis.1